MPVNTELRRLRLRQKDHQFVASLYYIDKPYLKHTNQLTKQQKYYQV
jgi:hypothetical protein